MKRILRLSALIGAIAAAIILAPLTSTSQSDAKADHRIYNNGGYYYGNGYGQGYYGNGYGQGYDTYNGGYGTWNAPRPYGYSVYGNGPYGYGNGYQNPGYYYGPSYGYGRVYSPYGRGVSTPFFQLRF